MSLIKKTAEIEVTYAFVALRRCLFIFHSTDTYMCSLDQDSLPCFSGVESECFTPDKRCNGVYDCPSDGADEWECKPRHCIHYVQFVTDSITYS